MQLPLKDRCRSEKRASLERSPIRGGDLLFGVVEAVFELPELDGIAGPRGFEDTLGLQDYRQFCGFPGGEATGDLE